MKICILGTGRSGTKAIYSVIQELLLDNYSCVDFFYEPFLWDKDIFNGRFNDVKNAFESLNSISIEGVYHHQKLPLFIENPHQYVNNDYLRCLLQPEYPKSNILLKFIRANGRIQLLHDICKGLKFVFIIRNPIDSVNSIMNRFSFFGGEFHHDDYPRFIDGINAKYNLQLDCNSIQTHFERELLFWYYMNRFALETFAAYNIPSLLICYEDFLVNPEPIVQKICDFLNCNYKVEYLRKSLEKVGDTTTKFDISEAEITLLNFYWEKYIDLLREFKIGNKISKERILQKYKIRPGNSVRTRRYYGTTPIKLINELLEAQKTMAELSLLVEKDNLDPK